MCRMTKFYVCKHYGNLIELIESTGVSVICDDDEMTGLIANTSDRARENRYLK